MKRIFTILTALFCCICLFSMQAAAQSDKENLRTAKEKLEKKACDTAFFLAASVEKTKSGKVQSLLQKAYPCMISKNIRNANAIKIGDKDAPTLVVEKVEKQLVFAKANSRADSILKLDVKEDVYKKLSKKRSIDKSIKTYNEKIATAKANIVKQARLKFIKDSITADSIRMVEAEALALKMKLDSIAADSLALLNNTVVATPTATGPATGKFYIIAGSYPSEAEAIENVEKLKRKGFPNARTVNRNSDGNLRICFNVYNTQAEAVRDLENIRGKYRKDAWVLEVR